MRTFFIILLIAIFFRPLRRMLFANGRVIIASAILFSAGYWLGQTLSEIAGPPWLKWLAGVVFVIEGLPEVLKYTDEISNQTGRRK